MQKRTKRAYSYNPFLFIYLLSFATHTHTHHDAANFRKVVMQLATMLIMGTELNFLR